VRDLYGRRRWLFRAGLAPDDVRGASASDRRIGRTRSERLRRCLESLVGRAFAIVYSGWATDDRVALAAGKGASSRLDTAGR